jgi:hypothetical protein
MAGATTARRRRRPLWPVAILGVLLLPVACTAWWFVSHDPAPHVAVLDELHLPAGWEVARTDAQRGPLFGPRAMRYYLVDAEPVDAATALRQALTAAGFAIYYRPVPRGGCALDPQDSGHPTCGNVVTKDCQTNGPGGPISCYIEGYRPIDGDPGHLEDIFASVSPRGSSFDHGPGASPRYTVDPTRALVVITASLSDPRHFWSGPTPSPGT